MLENVPATTFTSPEVASLGLSEAVAVEKYGADKIVVAERHLSHVDRAVCDGAQQGFIKIVYLKKNGMVLGATIVAPVAGEMISEIAVMMKTVCRLNRCVRVADGWALFWESYYYSVLTSFCILVVLI